MKFEWNIPVIHKGCEAIVAKHLGAMRDELRRRFPELDIVIQEVELDRSSNWMNFEYVCYRWIEDPKEAGDSDEEPVLRRYVRFPWSK